MLGIIFMLCSGSVCKGADLLLAGEDSAVERIVPIKLNYAGADSLEKEIVTPPFAEIDGIHNVKIVVRFCPAAGFDDELLFSVVNGGTITSAKLDGKALSEDLIGYILNRANLRLPKDRLAVPSSKPKSREWQTLELNVRNATNSTCLKLAGESSEAENRGFFVDSVKIIDLGEVQRSTLRVLYWNIQNGMWTDQPNGYKNFIAWVKKYDPDVCVWCEAASIYKDYSGQKAPADEKYLPAGWPEVAGKYGHTYTAVGGHRDNYPQVITSKYPIATLLKITDTDQPGRPVSHGASVQQVDVNGKKVNIVTLHTWPQQWCYTATVEERKESRAKFEGDKYREFEMKYIVEHTVNAPEFASHAEWLMMGDFNSPSMLDEWYNRILEKTPTKYLCQNVIRNNTTLVDIIGNYYKGYFMCSTAGISRIDNMYASPSMYSKVKNAMILIDSYTTLKSDSTYPSGFYYPSDHRPILVDFEF